MASQERRDSAYRSLNDGMNWHAPRLLVENSIPAYAFPTIEEYVE